SINLGDPLTSFTDILFRLSVLDLPLAGQQKQHQVTGSRERSMKLTAASPVLVFHRELNQVAPQDNSSSSSSSSAVAAAAPSAASISVSCSYFDPFDLYEQSSPDSGDERT